MGDCAHEGRLTPEVDRKVTVKREGNSNIKLSKVFHGGGVELDR